MRRRGPGRWRGHLAGCQPGEGSWSQHLAVKVDRGGVLDFDRQPWVSLYYRGFSRGWRLLGVTGTMAVTRNGFDGIRVVRARWDLAGKRMSDQSMQRHHCSVLRRDSGEPAILFFRY